MAKKKFGHVFGVLGIKHGEMRIKMYKTIAVLVCSMIIRWVFAKRQESHILHFCIQKSSRDEIPQGKMRDRRVYKKMKT